MLQKFGTKGETLRLLYGKLTNAIIDDLVLFSVQSWLEEKEKIVESIINFFGSEKLIIRSSAQTEDSTISSQAGHYYSVLNVCSEPTSIREAVEKVKASFDDQRLDNQIFIQKYLDEVEMSGVLFTCDINNYAPYYIINYDCDTGLTNSITSGTSKSHSTFIAFKKEIKTKDKRLEQLCMTARELEIFFSNNYLDIEFIITKGIIHIVQVRPIVKRENCELISIDEMHILLKKVAARISELSTPHPDLFGKQTLYGVMPDWNPAEMIGIKPRPLALSLYRELITDSIWAYQRDNYGYKRLRSFPLMISFAGQPFIDLRVDFNSFLPKALNNELSEKLTNYYLEKLLSQPSSHDKIEFDIVFSCYTLDLDKRLRNLLKLNFSEGDIKAIQKALLDLSVDIIRKDGLFVKDLKKIELLEQRRNNLLKSNQTVLSKIYWLVEDCKRYGTLPFAGIARAAFIAVQFLSSMIELKIITSSERDLFLKSLNTVAKQLSRDLWKLKVCEISKKEFINRYGHLRPGTYDILSENYEDNFEKYFDIKNIQKNKEDEFQFCFSEIHLQKIDSLLKDHTIPLSAQDLIDFIKSAIEGREYAKFSFTKNVNALLKLIKEYGEIFHIDADQLSYLRISSFLEPYSYIGGSLEKQSLIDEINRNKKIYSLCSKLKFPELICKSNDIYSFTINATQPNYITVHTTIAETIKIDSVSDASHLRNKIVFIENADPGYDWIFSHGIKGFITMYGGANSHMAIRATEMNIPAVVGCGELFYIDWSHASTIQLDCMNKRVVVIN